MEINLLCLNVGNSRLAIGVFVAGNLEYVNRVGHDQRADWPGRIAEAWSRIKDREDPVIVGASVHPELDAAMEQAVAQATGEQVKWIGNQIKLPIKVLTDQPEQTGVDRIVNIAAAYEEMGKACVVVDAGTAMTVDCCNDEGAFLGGAIFPGVRMMLDAMHEETARLPEVQFAVPTDAIGKNTRDAMLQGVYYGVRGLVKELVENYATELGHWPDIIATGGDARDLFEGWELIHAIAPDLTFYGIALAYANQDA